MKFNWGTGIVIVSVLFMSFIIMLVVKSYGHKVDLVSEDYYNQELHFQERIDKMNNVKSINDKVTWKIEDEEIVFQFPKGADSTLEGTLEFFRPSDSEKDRSFKILVDSEGKQQIQKALLMHGLYRIKIDWSIKNKGFYMEEDILIQ